ncbi:MAG: hypothetical protein ACI3ZY_00750 [Parabacteroides sp.]
MTKRLYCICCNVLSLLLFLSCHHDGEQIKLEEAVNYCWEYAQYHPNGFTLDISDYSVPKEGIVVAYMETQDSFGKEGLRVAVHHSLAHNQIVGGWYNDDNGKYYFDSDTIFQEDMLQEAIEWAKRNKQYGIFILSKNESISIR